MTHNWEKKKFLNAMQANSDGLSVLFLSSAHPTQICSLFHST